MYNVFYKYIQAAQLFQQALVILSNPLPEDTEHEGDYSGGVHRGVCT